MASLTNGFQKGHKYSMRKGDPRIKRGRRRGPDKKNKKRRMSIRTKDGKLIDYNRNTPRYTYKPEGTKEEMTLAWNQARGYQLVLLNYTEEEELPEEVLAHQRRLFHFTKKGPNANRFKLYGLSKLLYADVLFILSSKEPANRLASLFDISAETVKDIRQGKAPEWRDEYDLIRRLRKSVISRFKKNFKDVHITSLLDSDGKTIQHFSSKAKARDFRRTWLIYNQKIKAKLVDSWIKSGQIDSIYPIKETTVIT